MTMSSVWTNLFALTVLVVGIVFLIWGYVSPLSLALLIVAGSILLVLAYID
jgi:hypothetical protein